MDFELVEMIVMKKDLRLVCCLVDLLEVGWDMWMVVLKDDQLVVQMVWI
jgi:hypothetical protein